MPERCGFEWSDGWGDHECNAAAGHTTEHSCRCDTTTPLERSDPDA